MRQDGDPGREAAEEIAEDGGIDLDAGHSTILAMKNGLSTARAGTKSPVTPMRV